MLEEKFDGNGWSEYKNLVISEIKRIADYTKETRDAMDKHCETSHDEAKQNYKEIITLINSLEVRLLSKIAEMKQDVVALQVKAGIWGMVGGAIPVGIAIALWIIQSIFLKNGG